MADALWINASAGAPSYTANELRQAMALGLMYDGRKVGARQGVRPGLDQLQATLAGSTITVQPGVACVDPALTTPQGPYWVAIPIAETHPLTAADATNPRKDIVILRVYDHDEDASGLRLARTEYLVGTPAPTPSEPAVPAGALKLALIDVPASGGGSAVVTDRRVFTVATGGILPVAAAADITAAVEGRYRDRLDTNLLERDTGSVWETVADPAAFTAWPSWSPAWTSASSPQPALGNGTLIGSFKQVGKTVHSFMRLIWGSTTTGGTAEWLFTIPITTPASGTDFMQAILEDASATADYPGIVRMQSSTPHVRRIGAHTSAGAIGSVSATHPFTWASGDILIIRGTYHVV